MITAKGNVREASVSAVVIRCGCNDPTSHAGRVCPKPKAVEDHGTISYFHKSLLRRLFYRLVRLFKPRAYFGEGK